MAINERFAEFVIRLAIDEDFKEQFGKDPEGLMAEEGLSELDKAALRSDRALPVRVQIENVQSSGNPVPPKRYRAGGKRAAAKKR